MTEDMFGRSERQLFDPPAAAVASRPAEVALVVGGPSMWGPIQHLARVAEGIYRVDTASHGGDWLSSSRVDQVPASIVPFRGNRSWWEEDSDWSVVALRWPEEFTAGLFNSAAGVEREARLSLSYLHPEWIPLIDAARAADQGGSQ